MIDSQSVKATEADGRYGYDAGRKVEGCKRHARGDAGGRQFVLQACSADVQDRRRRRPVAQGFPQGGSLRPERLSRRTGSRATSVVIDVFKRRADQVGARAASRICSAGSPWAVCEPIAAIQSREARH